MKFNWGHGIFIGIIVCISALGTLVFITTREDIDLVVEEYYPRELQYDNEIRKLKNTRLLTEDISLAIDDSLYIHFPEFISNYTGVSGQIWFYRPSDAARDLKQRIDLNKDLYMAFPLTYFETGKYKVIIDWQYNGRSYLTKENIIF